MNRILTVIILFLFALTGYITYLVQERQNELQKLTRYTDSWSVSQIVSEYFRLETSLALYAVGSDDVSVDDVRLRLDIMISQTALLKEGDLGQFLRKSPKSLAIIADLQKYLTVLDTQLDTLSHAQIVQMLNGMRDLEAPLREIASESLTKDIDIVNSTHDKIHYLYYIYSFISLMLIVLSFTLGFLTLTRNNNLRKAHRKMELLAQDLHMSKEDLQSKNEKLEYVAYHDSLTGLPNRLLFWQKMQELIDTKSAVVVMLFDLDRFKAVNDTMGHDAGDKLLIDIAERLSLFINESVVLYRLGGDEFAILSSNLTEKQAYNLACAIRDNISMPYQVYGTSVSVETCIGLIVSSTETRADYLYKCVDLALYDAKSIGPGNVRIFQQYMLEDLLDNRSFENDLANAVKNDELMVYYQPIADARSGEIYGYEALLRWFHPVRGAISPEVFIPVAEKTGLIHSIGAWVLAQACQQATQWTPLTRVAVNISPLQLLDESLPDIVRTELKKNGLDASRLELEITESNFVNQSARSLATLRALSKLGLSISIDDFGTGYSSLSRLSSFAFDTIKIDRSFVSNITQQHGDLNILKAIVSLGKSLNMRIIAEGVETEVQLNYLQGLGCDLIQGYLIGKPAPPGQLRLH